MLPNNNIYKIKNEKDIKIKLFTISGNIDITINKNGRLNTVITIIHNSEIRFIIIINYDIDIIFSIFVISLFHLNYKCQVLL